MHSDVYGIHSDTFESMLYYPILSYPILFYIMLSYTILYYPVLYFPLYFPILCLVYPILYYPIPILSYPTVLPALELHLHLWSRCVSKCRHVHITQLLWRYTTQINQHCELKLCEMCLQISVSDHALSCTRTATCLAGR
jgi:hypothetical protein